MEKKIVKPEQGAQLEIRNFEMTNLNSAAPVFRTPTLETKKKSALPKVSDDAPRKDLRFHVDPSVGELLVDEDDHSEEEIARRVEERLAELRSAAEAEAAEKGYADGHARGESEAIARYEADARVRLESMDAILQTFEGLKDEAYKANERFLVELVLRMGSVILQKEIDADPEYLSRVIRSVVEKVGVKEQLRLIANAAQMDLLYGLLPEMEKRHANLKNISIEASSQLEHSDVVIETDWNRVDATVESQLGSLREVVLAALEQSQNSRGTDAPET